MALDMDKHAMGIYKEDMLVGHVPIDLSRIISYFLQEIETNELKVAVNDKRRPELGLVVPGKYCARTESKRTVKILGDQLKIIKKSMLISLDNTKSNKCIIKYPIKIKIS